MSTMKEEVSKTKNREGARPNQGKDENAKNIITEDYIAHYCKLERREKYNLQ